MALGSFIFWVAGFMTGETLATVSEADRYCHEVTRDTNSYCKSYLHVPVCHGYKTLCDEQTVSDWVLRTPEPAETHPTRSTYVPHAVDSGVVLDGGIPLGNPWDAISLREQDDFCHNQSRDRSSYCKIRHGRDEAVCHGSNIDCSRRAVYESRIRQALGTSAVSAPSSIPQTTSTRSPSSSRTSAGTSVLAVITTTGAGPTTTSTTGGLRGIAQTTTTAGITDSTQTTTTTSVSTPDPCLMADAILMGKSPTSGDSYFMPLASMRACMMNTKITHANAIWTLHNLHYGVAETYSFTDIATDSTRSIQNNVCNYRIHSVNVDLVGTIRGQLAEYNTLFSTMSTAETNQYLSQERPAYAFHSNLLKMMNRLHDAHTLYSTPFEMFRVYFPFNFGSKVVNGNQVITLRYSTDSNSAIGRLVYVYQRLYGSPPFPARYAGETVTHINGVSAINFLRGLVSDEGPLAGQYQQLEQRLNAFIFHTDLLVLGQVLATLPEYDRVTLRFAGGHTATVNLMGQFADLSTSPYHTTPNLRSTSALSVYMHTNNAFGTFLAQEAHLEEKKPTLWKHASASSSVHLRLRGLLRAGLAVSRWLQISKKHKALLDPVKNYMRDHLLNLPAVIDELVEEVASAPVPFVDADTLATAIKSSLFFTQLFPSFGSSSAPAAIPVFTDVGGMSYAFVRDTVVVKIPSMTPGPRFDGDGDYFFFPGFVTVQQEAKTRNINRLLFDVTDNGGGYVMSAYSLLWYTMADTTRICAPLRKRISPNWKQWLESFGEGLEAVVNRYLVPKGDALADELDAIFAEISRLVTVLYDGYGFTADQFGGISKNTALARVAAAKRSIAARTTNANKAAGIIEYIQNRRFVPDEASIKEQVLPGYGFCPFDPAEMIIPDSRQRQFTPPLSNYHNTELKNWGARPANYSMPGEYSFCYDVMQEMPIKGRGYETGYWTQIGVVSDGTCGSACALFTQGITTNGDAVAFTYGGMKDTALDVAAFAGGNVEEYADFWPGLSFGAKVGSLASRGEAPYTKAHEKSWVSSPIAFPTRASARFNWNMMFVEAMGDQALPRQFYLIPGRRHINTWGTDAQSVANLYAQIIGISDWAAIPAQFAATHGQCPREVRPFSNRPVRRLY